MEFSEKAKIIALAKLCGSTEPDEQILSRYSQYLREASERMNAAAGPNKVEVVKRPF